MLQYLPALVIAVALAVMAGIIFSVALCTDYRRGESGTDMPQGDVR